MGHKYYFSYNYYSDDECESFDSSDLDDDLFFPNKKDEDNFIELKRICRKIDEEIEEREKHGKSVERLERRYLKFSHKLSLARDLHMWDFLPPYPRD